jgi:hypothetical protein
MVRNQTAVFDDYLFNFVQTFYLGKLQETEISIGSLKSLAKLTFFSLEKIIPPGLKVFKRTVISLVFTQKPSNLSPLLLPVNKNVVMKKVYNDIAKSHYSRLIHNC